MPRLSLYWLLPGFKAGQDDPVVGNYLEVRKALHKEQFKVDDSDTNPVTGENALNWLYGVLTILDGKASALMRLNGVMVAAAAFLVSGSSWSDQLIVLLIALASSISIALCLIVVAVDWPFLGLITKTGAGFNFHEELKHLQRVSIIRQYVYRTAWFVSAIATLLFVEQFIARLIELF